MRQLLVLLALAACSAAQAQDPRGVGNEPGYNAPRAISEPKPLGPGQSFRGEVQGIDKASGRITLKHDTIEALGLRATTTDYSVKDGALLEHVKVGDRVRFNAVMQGRSLLVTNIVPAN
jgi:Cu/Ag efflux protein CusF